MGPSGSGAKERKPASTSSIDRPSHTANSLCGGCR
jgi:hypothetical protein